MKDLGPEFHTRMQAPCVDSLSNSLGAGKKSEVLEDYVRATVSLCTDSGTTCEPQLPSSSLLWCVRWRVAVCPMARCLVSYDSLP